MIKKYGDLEGQTFNNLKVLSRRVDGLYECQCLCGNSELVLLPRRDLIQNRRRSCGCGRNKKEDVIGQTRGYLVIREELPGQPRKGSNRIRRIVLAECSIELGGCGKIKQFQLDNLYAGNTVSCGECHIKEEQRKNANKTHGYRYNLLYNRARGELSRCLNPKDRAYPRYKDRGTEFTSVEEIVEYIMETFPNWEEEIAAGKVIDRIDNDRGYFKGNMRFCTQEVNANNTVRNRYVSYYGEKLSLTQAAKKAGLNPNTVKGRIEAGWHVEHALTHPIRCGVRPKDYDKPISGEVFLLNR